jgi:diguanylate cyclase (GGDEF)-like protein
MDTAFSLTPPVADDRGAQPANPAVGERRARQRRRMLDLVGVAFVIDACILLVYGSAGTISVAVGPAFAACGLISVAVFMALSETGFSDRFEDHYFVIPQLTVNLLILLGFAYAVPQVGMVFLLSLFVVVSFSSLRSTPRQTAIGWSTIAVGVAALFLLTDKPIALPVGNPIERFAAMLTLVLTIGRCAFLATLSSSLRETLYKRSVQLKEAFDRIEELAELDELTGAFNRRCIMRMLDDEISHAERHQVPLAVALIDLDWFKRINDTFGHPTGDEVLRTFAITIYANIRDVDRFGRYGGEEFLLVLPGADHDQAVHLLERLRRIVEQLDWHAFSPDMSVTISAGVSVLAPGEPPDSLLARADRALYTSKDLGRNRITSV